MPKKIAFTALFTILALILFTACGAQKTEEKNGATNPQKVADTQFGPPAPGPKPGEKAPSFQLPELVTNQEVAIPGDFQGKKVALLFFSSG